MVSVTHVDYTGAASPGPEFTSVDSHTKAGTKNPLFKAIVEEFGSESLLPHYPVATSAFVPVRKRCHLL